MGLKVRKQETIPQASRIFTDREIPRKSFWKNYNDFKAKMDDGDIKVLAYYGIGGIGKSTLLRKLISEMDEAQTAGTIGKSMHVYFDFNLKQDSRAVLENIRNKLVDDYGFDFPLFDLGCYIYAKKIGDDAEKKEVHAFSERSRILSVALDVAQNLPIVGFAAKIASLADKSLAVYRNIIAKNKDALIKIEGKSADELYNYLPILFSKDLNNNMEDSKDPLVIFLDTYEQLVNEMATIGEPLNNDLFLRDENDGLILNASKVLWVVAGREKLKWQKFLDWGDSLEQHILGNLSNTDAQNFLLNAGITDESLRSGIYKLTQGTPVYLDLCVDRYTSLLENGKAPKIEDFGQNIFALIERFARYMDDAKKDVVYILSCLKMWSDDMALEIGPKVLPNFSLTTYEKVKGFSFIIESDKNHFNLHQTVCDTLYKNCPDSIKQKTISAAIDYCKAKLDSANVFSNDFEYYIGWLMKYALNYYEDDEQFRVFYIEQIRTYLKKLSDAKRFGTIDELFEPFWERAARNKEVRLFALAEKDYSIWLQSKGKYQDALNIAKHSYELYVKLLGEDDVATLRAQREYAMILHIMGKYQEALEIRKSILEKRLRILDEKDREIIESLVDAADSCEKLGLHKERLQLCEQQLQLRIKTLGEKDPATFIAGNHVAKAYASLGDHQKAYELKHSIVQEMESVFGKDNEKTLLVMASEAESLKNLGCYQECQKLWKEIYERQNKLLGENHPETINSITELASIASKLGQYTEALPLRAKALEKRRTLLGELHPQTLKAIWGVAYALECLGRYQEALKLRKEIYEKYKQTQGEDFPDTITALSNVAYDYKNLGIYEKNLDLRKEIYERRNRLLGENHPDTVDALVNIANAYSNLGQHSSALPLQEKVLEKRKALFGEHHPKTLKAIWGVAYVLEQLGRYQEALDQRIEIYEKYKQTQGEDFPDTIDALCNVAYDYKNLGDFEKSLKLRKEICAKMEQLFGYEHPKAISARTSLAILYENMGRFDDSILFQKERLEIQKKNFGENSIKTIAALNSLAWAYFLKGSPEEGIPYAEEMRQKMACNPNVGKKDLISNLDTLALLYASANRLEDAFALAKKLLKDSMEWNPMDEIFIASRHYALAYILNKMDKYDEALDYVQKALDVRKKYLGDFNEATKRVVALLEEIKVNKSK